MVDIDYLVQTLKDGGFKDPLLGLDWEASLRSNLKPKVVRKRSSNK